MRRFYANTAEFAPELAPFGLTRERVERELAAVEALAAANIAQESAKGRAQEATRDRDAALEELRAHTRALEAAAKEVFRGRNDALVRLGLVRRGGRPARAHEEVADPASHAEFDAAQAVLPLAVDVRAA